MATEITGRLENWVKHSLPQVVILTGQVYDDYNDRFADSTQIQTSGVTSGTYEEGEVVTTHNSTYLLEAPCQGTR